MDPELQKWMKWLTKLGVLVLSLITIYLLFTYVFPLLGRGLAWLPVLFMPFILALILALLMEPLVRFVEVKAHLKRAGAAAVSLIAVVGTVFYLIFLVISVIVKELSRFYPQVVNYSDNIVATLTETISNFKLFYLKLNLPAGVEKSIQDNLGKILDVLRGLVDGSLNILINILTMLPGIFVFMAIVAVATFLIIKDRDVMQGFLLRFIPDSAQSKTMGVIRQLFQVMVGFIRAYSMLITVTMIVTMVGLAILGVDYVLTIGIVVGLCDILPVLGPGAIMVPWIIWEFASGNSKLGIGLLVLYVTTSVVRQILEPKIVGDNIGLHPLATLVSLYIGLQLGGMVGMILGPVTLVIIIACYRAGLFSRFEWRKND
ncbi:MAG: sporulation integral membrane protein YtvI [Deltaproteobacteria bacterium]